MAPKKKAAKAKPTESVDVADFNKNSYVGPTTPAELKASRLAARTALSPASLERRREARTAAEAEAESDD